MAPDNRAGSGSDANSSTHTHLGVLVLISAQRTILDPHAEDVHSGGFNADGELSLTARRIARDPVSQGRNELINGTEARQRQKKRRSGRNERRRATSGAQKKGYG